jgi:hypothetical protein
LNFGPATAVSERRLAEDDRRRERHARFECELDARHDIG